MRLARTPGPTALLGLLREIDATRAPLHPLLLQGWIIFSVLPSSRPALSSALCGILTVALVYWIGHEAFDRATGLWAAWLCAVSPVLVYYSREVRMYALLVLITCLGWGSLFANRRSCPTLVALALRTLPDRTGLHSSPGLVDGRGPGVRLAAQSPRPLESPGEPGYLPMPSSSWRYCPGLAGTSITSRNRSAACCLSGFCLACRSDSLAGTHGFLPFSYF